jgi:drug/metabolite transporter (DMT)-like permease
MTIEPWYWIAFTLAAAAAQAGRNATQRGLIAQIGTLGATLVRFLYGLPFGLGLCLLTHCAAGTDPFLLPSLPTLGWALIGAVAQIVATALMLAAMREKSFVVSTALTKVEPVWVALFGLLALGDPLGLPLVSAIAVSTAGVLALSWPASGTAWSLRPIALGLASGAFFAVAAVAFRGAILAHPEGSFELAASFVLALGLLIQAVLIVGVLLWRDLSLLGAIAHAWRASLLAGALGAFASQAWFLAFAVETAARVRTLALVEIVFAQLISRRFFSQRTTALEWLGMIGLFLGVILVLQR